MSERKANDVSESIAPRSHRLMVNCRPEDEGRDMHQEDEICAEGLICTDEEIGMFRSKSAAGCPTHGNCSMCMKSGPVGEKCKESHCTGTHLVAMVHREDELHRSMHWVDAVKLARKFGQGHEVARADRMVNWVDAPRMKFRRATLARKIFQSHVPQMLAEHNEMRLELFPGVQGNDPSVPGSEWRTPSPSVIDRAMPRCQTLCGPSQCCSQQNLLCNLAVTFLGILPRM